MLGRIYLDHINGRPLIPEARAVLQKALEQSANPSSLYAEGRRTSQAIQTARTQVAALIGADAQEIFFTSSGTEANHWALTALRSAQGKGGKHLVISAVEHLSILQTVRRLEKEGWHVSVVGVDSDGRVDPQKVERALTPETLLVSIQWANNEVGSLQPMEKLVRQVKAKGVLFHTDAVAAAGQVPIRVREIPVDALSLAANLWGGPSGVGALFVRKGVRILPLFLGGTQEEGRRAGTENLLGILGMGAAAEAAVRELPARAEKLTSLRDRLIRGILEQLPEATVNGHPTERLPGHVSVSVSGMDAEALVLALDMEGVAVGLGSACTAQTMKASHVLRAMGVEDSKALGTFTCTLGLENTVEEIQRFLDLLPRVIARQRGTVAQTASQ